MSESRVRITDLTLVETAGDDAKIIVETTAGTRILPLAKLRQPAPPNPNWTDVRNKPATFPPAAHGHTLATASAAGFMSPQQVQRLEDLEGYALDGVIDCGIG